MRTRRMGRCCTVVAMLLFAGCTDATAPPAEDATSGILSTREPTAGELEEMDSAFRVPTDIRRFTVGTAFEPGRAVGSAVMEYYANWAKVTLTLTVFRNGSPIASVTIPEVKTHLIPLFGSLSTATALPVAGDCGHSVTVNAVGEVRKELLVRFGSLFQWDYRQTGRTDMAHQPPCPSSCPTGGEGGSTPAVSPLTDTIALECTGEGGGGGTASGGYWVAVSTTHCYGYHYYDSTGRYLHSVITHCETTTSYYFQAA